jgi:hypothetical protein
MKLPTRKKVIVPCITEGCDNEVWRPSPDTCDECIWKLFLIVCIEFGLQMPERRPNWIGEAAPPMPDKPWW